MGKLKMLQQIGILMIMVNLKKIKTSFTTTWDSKSYLKMINILKIKNHWVRTQLMKMRSFWIDETLQTPNGTQNSSMDISQTSDVENVTQNETKKKKKKKKKNKDIE